MLKATTSIMPHFGKSYSYASVVLHSGKPERSKILPAHFHEKLLASLPSASTTAAIRVWSQLY